jgi:hypothetical protein
LAAGADTFGVPVVGGHTSRGRGGAYLSAAIVGHARRLITSFDARPGDVVIACVDLRGQFRADSYNFDAVSGAPIPQLRAQLELLPQLAEAELVHAGKDISNAGLVGSLLMLLETSGCGALLDLASVPSPVGTRAAPARWLQAFPSFGFLLSARARDAVEVIARAGAVGVHAAAIAELRSGSALDISYHGATERYWDVAQEPLLGFGTVKKEARHA